jgi:hypothetical protein
MDLERYHYIIQLDDTFVINVILHLSHCVQSLLLTNEILVEET